MAKRFTDTDKYKDPWFRKLTITGKMLFLFMCDDCNHAGIWKENLDSFNFIFQCNATKSDVEALKERVLRIDDDTYLIRSFIKFQYGKLNPANKAHLGVIRALLYVGIDYMPYIDEMKGLPSPTGIGIGTGEGAGNGIRNGTSTDFTTTDIPF
jgi:hypothetical protein